jgi:hypothetical protein
MEELGRAYINFNFDTYFQNLDILFQEFKTDTKMEKNIFGLVETCKKGVMITYILPYKNKVDMKEMASSFGMSIMDIELAVTNLISGGDVKGKIDSYNKVLHIKEDNYRVKSYAKALEAGEEFLHNVEISLNRHHLDMKKLDIGD